MCVCVCACWCFVTLHRQHYPYTDTQYTMFSMTVRAQVQFEYLRFSEQKLFGLSVDSVRIHHSETRNTVKNAIDDQNKKKNIVLRDTIPFKLYN